MNKKQLYESIMRNVAIEVKKALNERIYDVSFNSFYDNIMNTFVKQITNVLDSNGFEYKLKTPEYYKNNRDLITIFFDMKREKMNIDKDGHLYKVNGVYYDIESAKETKAANIKIILEISDIIASYDYENSGISIVLFLGGSANASVDISFIGSKVLGAEMPIYMYHICDEADVDNIMRYGLQAKAGNIDKASVLRSASNFNRYTSFNSLIRPYKGVFVFMDRPTAIKEYLKLYGIRELRWKKPVLLRIKAKNYTWYEDNVMDDYLEGTQYEKQYVQSLVTFSDIDKNDIEVIKL